MGQGFGPRRRLQGAVLVRGLMIVWVAAVYVVLVVGGGIVLGRTDRPSPLLSVIATAVVAMGFEPVREALDRRLAGSAYERLARFARVVTQTVATDQVAPELARRVGQAVDAAATEVWLLRSGAAGRAADLVARWSVGDRATAAGPAPTRRYPIRHGDEILGELVIREQPGRRPEPIEQRLVTDLCAQAGLALRHVQLSEDLRRRVAESTTRAAELRASRQRVVAAADAERRRLERDIHDGAQQHVIALAINLALARELLGANPAHVVSLLPHLRVAVEEALAVLEELGRGIYPRQLADEGIAVALRVATGTSALFVHVEDTTSRRYPQEIEAAAYFAGLEAVQNAVKHSGGSQVCVRLTDGSDGLRLEVSDDGQGFDVEAADAAAGTTHLRDRLEAVGGHVAVVSAPGAGTRVSCWIPVKVREELLA